MAVNREKKQNIRLGYKKILAKSTNKGKNRLTKW